MANVIVINEQPELEFEEERHIYRLNGIEIPSVSAVMKPLSSSVYGDVDPYVLSAAANRGTIVHEAIENYLNYGIEDIPSTYTGYLDAFISFWKEYKPTVYAVEHRMYHKYLKYAGTVDLLLDIDGETWLVDNKTSSKIEKMLTRVQLEAYKKGLATHGIRVDRKAILHLKKTGKFSFVEHPAEDQEAWDVFTSCKTVHDYVKTGGKWE